MKAGTSIIAAAVALLFLTACGSSDLGGVLGGSSTPSAGEIRGTVDSVDPATRSLILTNTTGYRSNLASAGANSVRIYFDDRTTVEYQGRNYRLEDLERGDQIAARVTESGGRLLAQRVTVTHNVAAGGAGGVGGTTGSVLRGTVTFVDTSRRTIEVDRGSGSRVVVEYETNTPVSYQGRVYRPADLERGDEIDIYVTDLGGGRYRAREITVVRSVSSGTSGFPSASGSTVRGTVRYVDTVRRTIELESASWISGFVTGTPSTRTVVVQYGTNTTVDVQGRLYPVENLERGDVIDVHVDNPSAATPFATRIVLVRDVNVR
jgi:hypothetical protein